VSRSDVEANRDLPSCVTIPSDAPAFRNRGGCERINSLKSSDVFRSRGAFCQMICERKRGERMNNLRDPITSNHLHHAIGIGIHGELSLLDFASTKKNSEFRGEFVNILNGNRKFLT
jgi:hypothetical protein